MITYKQFIEAYSVKHIQVLDALVQQVEECTGDEFGYLSDVKIPDGMKKKEFDVYISNFKENGFIEESGIADGYRVLIEDLDGEGSRKSEIRLINKLFEMDGYFKDVFHGVQRQMVDNIKNDFYLLSGTGFGDTEALERDVRILRGQLEERCNELEDLREQKRDMADFLIEQAEKWSASDLRVTAIEMVGEKEYLRRKIEKGFNLWAADKEMLMEVLRG